MSRGILIVITAVALSSCLVNLATADDSSNDTRASVKSPYSWLPEQSQPQNCPHLHNLLRVTVRIYSGGAPEDDRAFAELSELGVRTIVSVDGARPDVDAAAAYGLRYVHIPIGYDGIKGNEAGCIARLVREIKGPVYIHCHHGNHRAPAAAAIAGIVDGAPAGKSALKVLHKAGTSKTYGGLWRDVESYRPPPKDAQLPKLVAIAEVGSIAATMAQIDRASDSLSLSQIAKWQVPASHPDISPTQVSVLLKEAFRETVRHLETDNAYDDRFLRWMKEAEASVSRLQSAVESGNPRDADSAFSRVHSQCKRCHDEYRN